MLAAAERDRIQVPPLSDRWPDLQAADAYRSSFRPSPVLSEPRLMVSASVLVADSDEEARYLSGPSRVMALSLRTGRPLGPIVSPDDAAAALAEIDPVQAAEFFEKFPGTQVATTADRAVDELSALVERTGAAELMVTGTAFDIGTRQHTLEAIAARWSASVGV